MAEPDDDDLQRWATAHAALEAGLDRAGAAATAGLDEPAFDALAERVDAALGAAMEAETGEAPPPLLGRVDRALRAARAAQPAPMSLETYARAIAALEAGGDPTRRLALIGVTPGDVARAAAHYHPRLATDVALAASFAALRRG